MTIKKEIAAPVKFSKERLMKAAIFSNRKDALGAIIRDNEKVTIEEAQERLDKFMKGKVK